MILLVSSPRSHWLLAELWLSRASFLLWLPAGVLLRLAPLRTLLSPPATKVVRCRSARDDDGGGADKRIQGMFVGFGFTHRTEQPLAVSALVDIFCRESSVHLIRTRPYAVSYRRVTLGQITSRRYPYSARIRTCIR